MVNANEYKTKSNTINSEKYNSMPELRESLAVIGVVKEEMQDRKEKLCLCFQDTEQILVLNQTNLKTMIDAKGTDTDKWKGSQIKLILIPSTFAGKSVKSVLISEVI